LCVVDLAKHVVATGVGVYVRAFDSEPDEEDFEEYTGNESVIAMHIYRETACYVHLMITPTIAKFYPECDSPVPVVSINLVSVDLLKYSDSQFN
jgi:hypothetical protein